MSVTNYHLVLSFSPEVSKMTKVLFAVSTLFLVLSQSACFAAGYSSDGGWFIFPGGLGLIVLIILVVWLVRRRR